MGYLKNFIRSAKNTEVKDDNAKRTKQKKNSKAKSKGWTPERRARQAALMIERKPWLHSTGPKTQEGKLRASRNAYVDFPDREEVEAIIQFLQAQRKFLISLQKSLLYSKNQK